MSYSLLEKKIEKIIAEPIEAMGYGIVRIKIDEGTKNKTLQIMSERKSDKRLGIDDCTKINRTVSALLDVEDPIEGEYNLEISSPGIDRPLVREDDFNEYAGKEVKINTNLPIEGRKKFKGKLTGMSENNVKVFLTTENGEEEVLIPYDNVASAKLIITDELLREDAINNYN